MASSHFRRAVLTALAVLLVIPPGEARAIPSFARRYSVSCQLCHNVIPALSDFGEQFAGNGFRMAPREATPKTKETGDELLSLLEQLPLAARLDAYVQGFANGNTVTDFQTPYGLKVLSSGAISKSISYYFYAFLFERGEVGGVEDAFLYLDNVASAEFDVALGQFQVSDPMFKRELRLEFEDYAVYRARLGESPVDLTYDRGVMAIADVAGFTVTGEVFNGNGRGEALANRRFDGDGGKDVLLHVTRDLVEGVRLGAFGYYGRATSDGIRNETSMVGADATLSRGAFELNVQYIHREDDRPTFVLGEPRAKLDGGFGEILVRPAGSRWYGFALYNLVTTNRPVLNVRLGGPADVDRYETVSAGIGRLIKRNLRVTTELMYDIELEEGRWTLGFVTAF
jgi:hypothetical protein